MTSKVKGCRSRYSCCEGKVKSRGCVEMCKKCERPWGTPTEDCFVKEHNIVTVEKKGK